jgi:hypothetical protein
MADSYNPTIVKGDTVTWAMGLCGPTGAVYNLTGTTLTMEIRKSYYPGNQIVKYVQAVTAGTPFVAPDGITGGLGVIGTSGVIYVTVGSNYTNQFPDYVPVFYDIQMQYPNNGGIVTLVRGTINNLLQVTEN